eukprot:15452177-Alexandrium_andersonii.AAC.1
MRRSPKLPSTDGLPSSRYSAEARRAGTLRSKAAPPNDQRPPRAVQDAAEAIARQELLGLERVDDH